VLSETCESAPKMCCWGIEKGWVVVVVLGDRKGKRNEWKTCLDFASSEGFVYNSLTAFALKHAGLLMMAT
jgi:hypothetical protein